MKKISSGEQLLTYSKGIFLLLAVFFLGCNSDDAPPSVPNPDPETAVSGSSGNREISQVLQEGAIWKSICIPTKTGTEIQQWSFTKIDFLVEFIRYTDNACTNKDYGESVSFSGTYEISSNATPSPEGYQAREIDITFPDEVTLLSLVALSDDESKILMPDFGETRADSFSEAIEYAKSENETTAATSKNLEGEWHSTCAEIGKGKSMGIVLDVKGKQFSWHQFGFTDAQCEEQESKGRFSGTLVFGEQFTTDKGITVRELDFDYDNGNAERRIDAMDKTDSGRDVLRLSTHDRATGKRPTSLSPGLVFGKQDTGKSNTRKAENAPNFISNNEVLNQFVIPNGNFELKQKQESGADDSRYESGQFMKKMDVWNDFLSSQEDLHSGY